MRLKSVNNIWYISPLTNGSGRTMGISWGLLYGSPWNTFSLSDIWETSCPILVLPWTIISLSDSQDMTVIIISMHKIPVGMSRTKIITTAEQQDYQWSPDCCLLRIQMFSPRKPYTANCACAVTSVTMVTLFILGFVRLFLTFNITFRGWHEHWSICCNFLLLPPK